MQKYKLTFIGMFISTSLLLFTLITETDFFEIALNWLEQFEGLEVDEFIIPLLIVGLFFLLDLIRIKNSQKIEIEKFKIYKAMMASTHHVLNNFLNQMQLVKMTAEETPGFDPEILKLYTITVDDAARQIKALGDISNISERSIRESVAPKPPTA